MLIDNVKVYVKAGDGGNGGVAFHREKYVSHGGAKASADEALRKDLIEEMADVLMYYNDVMLCYGITADELKQAYSEKFEKNMKRW